MVVRRRFIAAMVITVPIAAIISAVTLQLRSPERHSADTVRAPATADVFLRDARLVETGSDGSIVYRIEARDAIYFNDRSIRMRGVTIRHFGADGGAWVVTADSGHIPAAARDIRLAGNVKMDGNPPRGTPVNVVTEELWVRAEREVLETESDVAIRSDDRRVTAGGMTTDWNAGSVSLRNGVRARYLPAGSIR